MISFMRNIQNRQLQTDRRWVSGCQGLEGCGMGKAAIGIRFLSESMKMSRMMNITVMIAQSHEPAENH